MSTLYTIYVVLVVLHLVGLIHLNIWVFLIPILVISGVFICLAFAYMKDKLQDKREKQRKFRAYLESMDKDTF
jgi:heme O synthase-like polyprenyltransferase